MKKQNSNNSSNKLINPVFVFFGLLMLVVANLHYEALLGKTMEVRVFGLSILLASLFVFPMLKKYNFLRDADFRVIKSPFLIIYFIWVVLQALSVFVAQNTGEALHEFLKAGTYLILFLFLFLYVVPQRSSREYFLKTLVVFTIIHSFIGVVQSLNIFSEFGFSFANVNLIKGNFSNKNLFSQSLFFGFTFSTTGIYFLKKYWKTLSVIASISSLFLILLFMTRGVWLALLASSVISFVLYFVFIHKAVEKSFLKGKRLIYFSSIVIVFVTVFTLFVSKTDYGQSIRNRIQASFKLSDSSTNSRFGLWNKTLDLWEENPVLGVGSGNWKIEILKSDVVKYRNGWVVPRRAHNDYLTILSENGIIGILAYLAMFILILSCLIRVMKRSQSQDDKMFALSIFFALIGYLCFSFFSFSRERVETQIILNILFAFSLFYSRQLKYKHETKANSKVFPFVLIFALGFSTVTAYSSMKRMQAEIAVNKMYIQISEKRNMASIYPLVRDIRSPFVSVSPRNTPFLGLKAKFMNNLGKDKEAVLDVYFDALKDSPYHVRTIVEIAEIYDMSGDYDQALKFGNQAYKYAPSNELVLLRMAFYYERVEQLDSSLYYLNQVTPRTYQDSYFPQITRVLKKKAIVLLDKEEDQRMKFAIADVANADEGKNLRIYYKRSLNRGTTFEIEFLKEVQKTFENEHSIYAEEYTSPLLREYNVIESK